jgi:4-amino-4-deoxy-L-arabinose transferase-like glycosyltransferase
MSKRKSTPASSPSNQKTVAEAIVESTPAKPISQWVYIGIAAIFVAIIIVARMNLAAIPFERDEGSYGYMGQLLLEGKKPYQYFYEMKLPGIFYCYAALVALFGKTISGLHIGFMFITLLSTLVIFLISKQLFDTRAGAVAAISFSILTLNKFASGFAAQGEHFVVFWALLGIYFTIVGIKSNKWYNYLIAGIFLGMAVLVKQSGVFFAVAAGLFMVANFIKPLNIKAILINGIILVGGFLAILGVFTGIIAMQGGWNEMMYWVFEHAQKYTSSIPFSTPDPKDIDGMLMMTNTVNAVSTEYMGLWYLAGLGVLISWISSMDLYKKIGLTLLIVLAFLSTSPGLRFYGHYFIQFMPALALLIATFVFAAGDVAANKLNIKWGGTAAFALFIIIALGVVNKQKNYYFSPDYLNILRQVYGDNPFSECKAVADKIKTLSKPEDKLAVWGAEPQLYFDTQLHCPYRHSFISFTSPMDDNAKAWREEVKKDVEEAKPRFFVIVNHPFAWSLPPGSDADLFQWGYKYVNQYYDLVGFADIIPGQRPAYVWDQAALTYKPKGQKYLVVFKRKDGI